MDALDNWDVALFAIAGYIAIMSLVRLMLARRSVLAQQVQEELERRRQNELAAEEAERIRAAQAAPIPVPLAKKKA
jgi:hypothetical protein